MEACELHGESGKLAGLRWDEKLCTYKFDEQRWNEYVKVRIQIILNCHIIYCYRD